MARSPSLISVVPNLFPLVATGCVLYVAGQSLEIVSVCAFTVCLGIAVDDTIHFLTWFRRGLDATGDRCKAIMLAYERCATPMTQTTIISGLGLSVFALSTFMPTQRFGYLMVTLLTAALVGDLLLLPAMLAGTLGRVFDRKGKKQEAADTAAKAELLEGKGPTPAAQGATGKPRTDDSRETVLH